MFRRIPQFCFAIFLLGVVAQPIAAQDDSQDAPKGAEQLQKKDAGAPEVADKESKPGAGTEFIRITRNEADVPTAMQTAIVRYVRPAKPAAKGQEQLPKATVDLVGVVHVGEKGYYEEFNRRFEGYDALLYELVAPENAVPDKEQQDEGGGILSAIQRGMKNMLELEFQLDWIDYKAKNFVHADMSPDEFSKSMADRGESIWTIVMRMMVQSMAMQSQNANQNVEAEMFLALFDKNRALKLKRIVAEQFQDLDAAMNVFNGPDGSVIITERNKKALAVLGRQLEKGKTNLALFYGAGHMPDMEERLMKMGFKKEKSEWLTAWDLSDKKQEAGDEKSQDDKSQKKTKQ